MPDPMICADCGQEIPDSDHDFIFDVDKVTGRMCARHLRCPELRAASTQTNNKSRNTTAQTMPTGHKE